MPTRIRPSAIKILARAIEEPLRQIVENAGEDAAVILNRVKEGKGSFGYNAATGEFGDMIEAGILDPTKVTRLALQNSASVSGLLLTTEVMIAEAPKDDDHGHGMPRAAWAAWAAWTCKCLNEIRHPESVIYGSYADRMDGSWRKPRPIRKRRGSRPPISAQYSNPASAGFFLTCSIIPGLLCAPHDHDDMTRMTLIRVPETASPRVQQSAPQVAAASGFVAEACERDPSLLPSLVGERGSGDCRRLPMRSASFTARAPGLGRPVREPDEAGLMAALRRWRTREMVRMAWRDLAGFAAIAETLLEQSAFARSAIQQAHQHASADAHAAPRCAALGRAASRRNSSSWAWASSAVGNSISPRTSTWCSCFPNTARPMVRAPLANEDFFTRLGQLLIRLLETRTPEGYLFRVDMRLRPFGDSGALVASFGAFEDYLQGQGRDWERYAWVKARPMTGQAEYARIYDSAVRPFVYRRYLDYGVFESLRDMKAMIEREVERRDLGGNVKLGPGGIREIEFLAQSLQLIRGGREPWLRTPSLLKVLPLLDRSRLLPPGAAVELRAAYEFLRLIENRLQERADEQTHILPDDAGAAGQPGPGHVAARLAGAAGHAGRAS